MHRISHNVQFLFLATVLLCAKQPLLSAEDEHDHGHDHDHTEAAPVVDSHEGHDHAEETAHVEEGHDDHGHEEGHSDEVTITPAAMKMFDITLQTVTLQTLTETATVPGRVSYNKEAMAHVGSALNGRAKEIVVRLGDTVKKGDLLAVVESVELGQSGSALLEKRSLVEAAEIAVEIARFNLERANELRKSNSISVSEILAKTGELKKAEGDLKVAEASFNAIQNELLLLGLSQVQVQQILTTKEVSPRYELRAPIDGQIIKREVTAGELVGPEKELLFVIADTTTLWILAEVPEQLAHRIVEGSHGTVTLSHSKTARLQGTVTYVAPELNTRTRTAQVRLVVDSNQNPSQHGQSGHHGHHESSPAPALSVEETAQYKAAGDWCPEHNTPESTCVLCNPSLQLATSPAAPNTSASQLLRPGLFVEVELELEDTFGTTPSQVVAVSMDAIQTIEGRETVFIPAVEPNTFTPATVVFGKRVGRMVPVLSGLNTGDSYVATGSFILKAEHGKSGAEHVH